MGGKQTGLRALADQACQFDSAPNKWKAICFDPLATTKLIVNDLQEVFRLRPSRLGLPHHEGNNYFVQRLEASALRGSAVLLFDLLFVGAWRLRGRCKLRC